MVTICTLMNGNNMHTDEWYKQRYTMTGNTVDNHVDNILDKLPNKKLQSYIADVEYDSAAIAIDNQTGKVYYSSQRYSKAIFNKLINEYISNSIIDRWFLPNTDVDCEIVANILRTVNSTDYDVLSITNHKKTSKYTENVRTCYNIWRNSIHNILHDTTLGTTLSTELGTELDKHFKQLEVLDLSDDNIDMLEHQLQSMFYEVSDEVSDVFYDTWEENFANLKHTADEHTFTPVCMTSL